jgi:hypothetical protein
MFCYPIEIRIFLILVMMFGALGVMDARIVKPWTYQEMFDKADLVVVAEALSTKDTGERSTLQDLEPHVGVIGIVTEFKSRLILKGAQIVKTFQLHHYRFQSEDDKLAADGPDLVELSGQHQVFLLFLIKERDGRYAPVTGQTDPASFAVLELKGAAR